MSQGERSISITTGQLAELLNAQLIGPADIALSGVDQLSSASASDLTFIRSSKFASAWSACKARAALVSAGVDVPGHDASARALLIVPDADLAMNAILEKLAPAPEKPAPGVHVSSVVDASAQVDPSAHVGPLCVVGPGCVIGPGCVLVSSVSLGAGVKLGAGVTLHPGVRVLDRCEIGDRCTLWANVVIGADGFAYRPTKTGLSKVPHHGIVKIASDVEIGAGTTVDRGRFGATSIGAGTKIDNLVQIGHNCQIGKHVVICGCAGLAGSVVVGDGVMIGGGAGVADNLTIGAGGKIAAQSGVMRDVAPGETVVGAPAIPQKQWARMSVQLLKLGEPGVKMKTQE